MMWERDSGEERASLVSEWLKISKHILLFINMRNKSCVHWFAFDGSSLMVH
jgi:hypothetical protein